MVYQTLINHDQQPHYLSTQTVPTRDLSKYQSWLAEGRWFAPGTPVSSINKTDRHDITEILLKVALNTTKQTNIKLQSTSMSGPSGATNSI